ncbi:MAG: hypothetical protein LLG05_05790 [Porphyromonadaceae bacterium]|nr:hypothetical protein [Porphyromonadaceae bacterium]
MLQNIQTPKPSHIADMMAFKMAWQYYPKKSFITGLWLRDLENTELFLNVFTRVLNKHEYPYFKHYLKNIALTTISEHSIWETGNEQLQISYSQEVEKQFGGKIKADWEKMKVLAEVLKKEYAEYFPYTHKGIVGYKYSLETQLEILSRINKKFLEGKRN